MMPSNIQMLRNPHKIHFQVGIASKYMGPIILSLNYMMKDVLLFLITFTVIMLAFASGVAYIFNMAAGLIILNSGQSSLLNVVFGIQGILK
jgi:hypothetical protein